MIAYGLIFQIGFLNFYLSTGLSLWMMALLWRPRLPWCWLALPLAVLALLALPLEPYRMPHWTMRLAVALLITAVLSTGFAFSVQNWAQRYTPATHTALIFALEPVFAALTSRVALGEHFGGKAALGSVLVLGGMVVSEVWGSAQPTPVEG